MDNFFGQNDYFAVFIETGPLSCGDNYVNLHQPLICVAHDTNLFVCQQVECAVYLRMPAYCSLCIAAG